MRLFTHTLRNWAESDFVRFSRLYINVVTRRIGKQRKESRKSILHGCELRAERVSVDTESRLKACEHSMFLRL